VDFSGLFIKDGLIRSEFFWDGLHPGAEGSAAMAELLREKLLEFGFGEEKEEEDT